MTASAPPTSATDHEITAGEPRWPSARATSWPGSSSTSVAAVEPQPEAEAGLREEPRDPEQRQREQKPRQATVEQAVLMPVHRSSSSAEPEASHAAASR